MGSYNFNTPVLALKMGFNQPEIYNMKFPWDCDLLRRQPSFQGLSSYFPIGGGKMRDPRNRLPGCISMDTSPEFTSVKKKTTQTQVFRESMADLEEGPGGPGLP